MSAPSIPTVQLRNLSNPDNKARGVRPRNDVLVELELRGGMRSSVVNECLELYLALTRQTWAAGPMPFSVSEIAIIWEALEQPRSPIGMRDFGLVWLIVERALEAHQEIEARWQLPHSNVGRKLQAAAPVTLAALLDGYLRWRVKREASDHPSNDLGLMEAVLREGGWHGSYGPPNGQSAAD